MADTVVLEATNESCGSSSLPWGTNNRKKNMEISRLTFRTFLYEAVKDREKHERKVWHYDRDSAMLAIMREMLNRTESDESIIYLRD